MFTDVSGIESTINIIIWIWALCVAFGAIVFLRAICMYDRSNNLLLIVISFGLVPAIITLALFPVIYSIISIIHQQIFEISFWQREISNGFFALRFTSIILTYQLVISIIKFIPIRRKLIAARKTRGLNNDDVADFTKSVTTEERQLWRNNDLMLLAFFQFSFYLITLTALLGCYIAGIHTVWTALASWLLLFICDDWSIITRYCQKFNSLPINLDAIKVLCIDIILLIAAPTALYPANLGIIWFAILLALFISIIITAIFFWRARHFSVIDT